MPIKKKRIPVHFVKKRLSIFLRQLICNKNVRTYSKLNIKIGYHFKDIVYMKEISYLPWREINTTDKKKRVFDWLKRFH